MPQIRCRRSDGLSALATHHVAVDHQRVRNQLGVGAIEWVHSECRSEWRMTVPWQCSHPASHFRHVTPMGRSYHRGPTNRGWRARGEPPEWGRTSCPAELVQSVVVDTEVVGDLVDDGDGDLVDDLRLGVAHLQQGVAVERDGVRQRAGVGGVALGQRDALVEPEQVGLVGMAVLDQDDDVVDRGGQLRPGSDPARRTPVLRSGAGSSARASVSGRGRDRVPGSGRRRGGPGAGLPAGRTGGASAGGGGASWGRRRPVRRRRIERVALWRRRAGSVCGCGRGLGGGLLRKVLGLLARVTAARRCRRTRRARAEPDDDRSPMTDEPEPETRTAATVLPRNPASESAAG